MLNDFPIEHVIKERGLRMTEYMPVVTMRREGKLMLIATDRGRAFCETVVDGWGLAQVMDVPERPTDYLARFALRDDGGPPHAQIKEARKILPQVDELSKELIPEKEIMTKVAFMRMSAYSGVDFQKFTSFMLGRHPAHLQFKTVPQMIADQYWVFVEFAGSAEAEAFVADAVTHYVTDEYASKGTISDSKGVRPAPVQYDQKACSCRLARIDGFMFWCRDGHKNKQGLYRGIP